MASVSGSNSAPSRSGTADHRCPLPPAPAKSFTDQVPFAPLTLGMTISRSPRRLGSPPVSTLADTMPSQRAASAPTSGIVPGNKTGLSAFRMRSNCRQPGRSLQNQNWHVFSIVVNSVRRPWPVRARPKAVCPVTSQAAVGRQPGERAHPADLRTLSPASTALVVVTHHRQHIITSIEVRKERAERTCQYRSAFLFLAVEHGVREEMSCNMS